MYSAEINKRIRVHYSPNTCMEHNVEGKHQHLIAIIASAACLQESKKVRERSDYLGIKSLLDADSPLNLGLTSLNLSHQTFNVLQLTAAFPEHTRVLHHLSNTCVH